jgi:hypothetical protein
VAPKQPIPNSAAVLAPLHSTIGCTHEKLPLNDFVSTAENPSAEDEAPARTAIQTLLISAQEHSVKFRGLQNIR